MDRQEDISALQHVGKILIDQTRLYDRAAELADTPETEQLIRHTSSERAAFLRQVQRSLAEAGGEPASHGTMLGAAHEAFLNARSAVDDDAKAAIGEVERGEDYLRDELSKCLKRDGLSADTRGFLSALLTGTTQAHDHVAAAKHALDQAGDLRN